MINASRQLSRRRFLGNFAFASAAIAAGPGRWIICPGWGNDAEGPIRRGLVCGISRALGFVGNTDTTCARLPSNERQ